MTAPYGWERVASAMFGEVFWKGSGLENLYSCDLCGAVVYSDDPWNEYSNIKKHDRRFHGEA